MWEDPLSLLWENDILARNLGLQFCPLPMEWIFPNAMELTFCKTDLSAKRCIGKGDKIEGEVYHYIIPGNKRGKNTQR